MRDIYFPEVAKRRIGDGEPGESEDPRDKQSKTGKEEERGTNRSVGECEEFAKIIQI